MLLAAVDRSGAADDARRRAWSDSKRVVTGSSAARQLEVLRRSEEAARATETVREVGDHSGDRKCTFCAHSVQGSYSSR